MIMLAVVPPVWRRVVDHRVLEHYGGEVTRANIQPRARGRVLAKYGGPSAPAAGAA
jgi:alkane 1-monooxygenase